MIEDSKQYIITAPCLQFVQCSNQGITKVFLKHKNAKNIKISEVEDHQIIRQLEDNEFTYNSITNELILPPDHVEGKAYMVKYDYDLEKLNKGFKMIKVIFQDSNGQERLLSEVETEQDGQKVINDFLAEHNFVSYYQNIYALGNRKYIDVGSWSEKFIFEYVEGVEIKL